MEHIKTYEGFIQRLKDYWNHDTSKKYPTISEIESLCKDSLIDLDDIGLTISYKAGKSGIKFDHSGQYTEEKDISFTIEICNAVSDGYVPFSIESIKSEVLFVVDLIKTKYNCDNIVVMYDKGKNRPAADDADYIIAMGEYFAGDPKKIKFSEFENLPNMDIKKFAITFNNITSK